MDTDLTPYFEEAMNELNQNGGFINFGSGEGGSDSKYEITWNKTINATQEVIEGTNIPKSFIVKGLNVNGKEVWVHGNATNTWENL